MLLGAFAEAKVPKHILDIGTGSGVLALMLAQKYELAIITAIDIDETSLIDCSNNFKNSKWSNRMECKYQDIKLFESATLFDLIICNPPFYENALVGENIRMNNAKHETSNVLASIFMKAQKNISEKGLFWIILPFETTEKWIQFAKDNNWSVSSQITLFSKENQPKRSIISFSLFEDVVLQKTDFIIRDSENNYTKEYIALTKDFHNRSL